MNPFQVDTLPQFAVSNDSAGTSPSGRPTQIMNTKTATNRPGRSARGRRPERAADRPPSDRGPSPRIRWKWLALWAFLATFTVFEVVKHGFANGTAGDAVVLSGVAFACFIAPDLTFVIGIGEPVEQGHLARRAVPWYNRMHRMWLPFALTSLIGILLAPLAMVPLAMFIGGLSWMAHIALDRAAGYGLRNPDGSRQRS